MLSAVLGLFSQDLAVDLGTSTTRLYQRGAGLVCQEPTVVAVHTSRHGRRRVLAVGDDARPMLGRTPRDVEAVQPVRGGSIHDFEVAEAFLLHLVRRVHGRNGWVSPRMVVAVPWTTTDMERRAVREACEAAGGREVHLVARPLAAAFGADLPVHEPSGHMIVDIGGGATEISVLSMSGVVTSEVVHGGGEGLDDAIVEHLRVDHGLLVGRPTAEAVKVELGAAAGGGDRTRTVKGRCMRRGVPRAVEVSAADVERALAPRVREIGDAVRRVLERTAPELASDVVDHGVVLTGGGSLLTHLDRALREATGLPVVRADDPERAVVHGAGRVLEESDLLEAIAC